MKINSYFLQELPEEVDYLVLMDVLREYKQPRNKVRDLLKKNDLIRVKKGLYVINPKVSKKSYSREVVANLIYGPSAISFEYALAFYGMIPERVETITSITSKRDKVFSTPLGIFTYKYIHITKYIVGINLVSLGQKNIIISSPEKALSDCLSKIPALIDINDLYKYLHEDLRIESSNLKNLDQKLLLFLGKVYNNVNMKLLTRICR